MVDLIDSTMRTHTMRITAALLAAVNVYGIALTAYYQPISYPIIVTSAAIIILVFLV